MNSLRLTASLGENRERGLHMWVFDGEQWTREGATEGSKPTPPAPHLDYDQMVPELQVVEIIPIIRKPEEIVRIFPVP